MDITQKLKEIGNATFKMAISGNHDLNKLSPKKQTALNCVTFGINETSMSDNLKQSFFNSAYYMMRLISDSEVDKVIEASGEGYYFYVMNHFYDDIDNMNMDKNGKDMFKMLMSKYKKSNEDAVLDSKSLKEKFYLS